MISVKNMGRFYLKSKKEAEDLLKLEIYWFNKHDLLNDYKFGEIKWTNLYGIISRIGFTVSIKNNYIQLQYIQTDKLKNKKKEFDYKIMLETTSCNFGSIRYWFVCPIIKNGSICGRRVGVLYKGDNYFGCRHCYNLTYRSRNENRRCIYYSMVRLILYFKKFESIMSQTKRPYYNGKLIKRLNKLKRK